jgi:hypothetical protein
MQFLPLYNQSSLICTVSDEDFEYLHQFRWTLCNSYVRRSLGGGYLYLHHEIAERMGLSIPFGHQIDHFDRFPLNNVRENLRVVTVAENNRHRKHYLRCLDSYVSFA